MRHQDPKYLLKHGFKVYSHADEDGIIKEILKRIGVGQTTFVEIGCGSGIENNTVYLLMQGWSGLRMDADTLKIESIAKPSSPFSVPECCVSSRRWSREKM